MSSDWQMFYLNLHFNFERAKTQAVILLSFKLTTKYLHILSFMTLTFNKQLRQQTSTFHNTQQQANTTLTRKRAAGQEGYIWAESSQSKGDRQWDAGERERQTGDRHQGNQTGETRGADRRAESENHISNKTVVHLSSVWTSSFPPVSCFLSEKHH